MHIIRIMVFVTSIIFLFSCSTGINTIQYNIESNNIIEKSIFDYSKTMAKKFPKGIIFFVNAKDGKNSKFVSISDGTLKHVYNNKKQMKEDNLKGRLKEVDDRLYLISDDSNIINDYDLAIKYGYIIIDNKTENSYYIDELVDDELKKIMTYIFCDENINNNIRVYYNSWDKFSLANKKLNCGVN